MICTPLTTLKHGLLLVGHGTRDREGCDEFLATAGAVAERLERIVVEPCFLELAEPTIDAAVAKVAEREISQLSVMPLLLFAAAHAKDDIPQAVQAAVEANGLEQHLQPTRDGLVRQFPHLGCHAKLLELSASRFEEAVEKKNLTNNARPRGSWQSRCGGDGRDASLCRDAKATYARQLQRSLLRRDGRTAD